MTLALRRTAFADGERRPDDYEVRYQGQTVGRIYRMRSTGRASRCALTSDLRGARHLYLPSQRRRPSPVRPPRSD
jgi:hypothetical protein